MRAGRVDVEWFKGGVTNLCYNCLDRYVVAGVLFALLRHARARDHTYTNTNTTKQTNKTSHVEAGNGEVPALLWEGNDVGRDASLTYAEVLAEVCRLANWLRSVGVKKGDAVAVYMPMLAELPIAMLACARIGAMHSVVFGGFSAEALGSRIEDCKAKVLLTASGVKRGPKAIDLKVYWFWFVFWVGVDFV